MIPPNKGIYRDYLSSIEIERILYELSYFLETSYSFYLLLLT